MQELRVEGVVELPTQPCDGDVDHVVEGCGPCRHLPNVPGQHLARYHPAGMAEQVLEDLELLRGQVQKLGSSRDAPSDEIHLDIVVLQLQHLIHPPAPKQSANTGEQFREGEGFDEVIIGATVESVNSVVDRVPCREDQDRCLDAPVPERAEDFKTITPWKHQVEDEEVEDFGDRPK